MLKDSLQFVWFSGTGNTLLVVKEMIAVFRNTGIDVHTHRMETISPADVDPAITLGLAFPVAFQSTYPFIWKFFHSLPEVDGTPVFMVDTMMSFSGAIVGPLKKVLTKKGYRCIGAKEIVMPGNWLRKHDVTEKDTLTVEKGKESARTYAKSLITGSAGWNRIPLLSDGFHLMCCNSFVMNRFCLAIGKNLTVAVKKCIHCGLCAELCPVGNITFNKTPVWGTSCEVCMRCVNFCPAGAISLSGKPPVPYRAVSQKEITGKIPAD